ncbi:hypothetical protein [Sphingobium yanoikuyae]|uniref:DUF4760 domain-containing protein n=1 Tax=Sphingobium yanoikuyae TaxID=13690 RepID=A0A0J9CYR0_SPHYA|nr:hypothetical protein [Sphingobium yanoikuyae]ATP18552.1 hypothetical protein BV87_09220 [Sphingobium yanoikuyae]KMW30187.1 hypothetical protein BV87_07405 [Sphingobium yanoikuyae]
MADVEDRKITNPVVRWVGNGMVAVAVTIFILYILDYQLGWIDCWAFEWGDFATLVTGAIAAIGAVWIGIRQSKISDRQTEILNHQVEIERISLRAELYDRRMKCFSDIVVFAANTGFTDEKSTGVTFREFSMAVASVKFLFNEEIYDVAATMRRHVMSYRALRVDMDNWDRFDAEERSEQGKRSRRSAAAARDHSEMFEKLATPMMRIDRDERI